MGGKSSPPPAPDYAGAARAQQASQFVNQYTPYGSQVYNFQPARYRQNPAQPASGGAPDGGGSVFQKFSSDSANGYGPSSFGGGAPSQEVVRPEQWSATTTLTPQAQATLDKQMAMSSGLASLAQSQLGGVSDFY